MEINQGLQPIGNQYARFRNQSTKMPPQTPQQSGGSMRLNSRPPLVIPESMPREIMTRHMSSIDVDAIAKFLETYQKKRPDWDVFRGTIPEYLLAKWGNVVSECARNGFVAPECHGGVIVFSQVLANPENVQNSDRCTMCQNHFSTGRCKGKFKVASGRRNFVKCWEA